MDFANGDGAAYAFCMGSRCPLCCREDSLLVLERHHLRTRKADRERIERICHLCHKAIHALWTNAELADPRRELDSVEGLLRDPRFARAAAFNGRVRPGLDPRQRPSRHRRRKKRR